MEVKKVEAKAAPKAAPKAAAGLSVSVVGINGEKKGTVTLSKEIFGATVNPKLMAQAVRVYLVNQRQGTQSTKTRGEVRGSTRKIYRQKGTGKARHGGIRAPIFVGGGLAFGPRPRTFDLKLSKQMRRKALFSALTEKLSKNQIFVVDVEAATGKTKEMANLFKVLNLPKTKVFFVRGEKVEVGRAVKNIEGLTCEPAQSLNTYEILNSKSVVFAKDAIEKLEKTFLAEK